MISIKKYARFFFILSCFAFALSTATLLSGCQYAKAAITGTGETADLVVVFKERRELQLWRDGQVLKKYRVALGKSPVGTKQREGDGKTPEGMYLLTNHNASSNFHLSIQIDYPNADDIAKASKNGARPGGMIMIHGLPNNHSAKEVGHPKSDWTDGCIAVDNKEIEEIWQRVPAGTPIMIMP